jgi:hypothetical protein
MATEEAVRPCTEGDAQLEKQMIERAAIVFGALKLRPSPGRTCSPGSAC